MDERQSRDLAEIWKREACRAGHTAEHGRHYPGEDERPGGEHSPAEAEGDCHPRGSVRVRRIDALRICDDLIGFLTAMHYDLAL